MYLFETKPLIFYFLFKRIYLKWNKFSNKKFIDLEHNNVLVELEQYVKDLLLVMIDYVVIIIKKLKCLNKEQVQNNMNN